MVVGRCRCAVAVDVVSVVVDMSNLEGGSLGGEIAPAACAGELAAEPSHLFIIYYLNIYVINRKS